MKLEDLRKTENQALLLKLMGYPVFLCPLCGHIGESAMGGLQVKCTNTDCPFIMGTRQMHLQHPPVSIKAPQNWKQIRDKNMSPGYCHFECGPDPKQTAKFLCNPRMPR